jgi:hypothetical protein
MTGEVLLAREAPLLFMPACPVAFLGRMKLC